MIVWMMSQLPTAAKPGNDPNSAVIKYFPGCGQHWSRVSRGLLPQLRYWQHLVSQSNNNRYHMCCWLLSELSTSRLHTLMIRGQLQNFFCSPQLFILAADLFSLATVVPVQCWPGHCSGCLVTHQPCCHTWEAGEEEGRLSNCSHYQDSVWAECGMEQKREISHRVRVFGHTILYWDIYQPDRLFNP